jgi:hypothetical protein
MELSIIQSKIYEIRGYRVMLDFDLAGIYRVETRVLNQAVKRNMRRFPDDFMFQLSEKEWEGISSQFVMTSRVKRPKSAYPFAFTEHGVTMLSSVLRSDIAIDASILIVRAFVAIRQLVLNPPTDRITKIENRMNDLKAYVEDIFTDQNDINEDTRMQLELINEALAELQVKHRDANKPRNPIGFKM